METAWRVSAPPWLRRWQRPLLSRVARISRDFRFEPFARVHRTPLLPSTQRNLSLKQAPAKISGSDGSFCPSAEDRLLPRNRFLRHCSDLSPSAPDFATAIGVPPVRRRQCPDPAQHRTEHPPRQMSLGQQESIVPGMLDQTSAGVHQPLRQAHSWSPARFLSGSPLGGSLWRYSIRRD